MDPEKLKRQAQEAIARGADPAKVNARLAQLLGAQDTPQAQDTPSDGVTAGSVVKTLAGMTPAGILGRAVTHPMETLTNIGQGVPGGKAAQAGFAMLGSRLPFGLGGDQGPLSYDEAIGAIDKVTKDTPTPNRLAAMVPGAVAMGTSRLFSPNIVKGGAQIEALSDLLSAKDESLGQRAANTARGGVTGAAAGAAIGGASKGIASLRAFAGTANRIRQAPNVAQNIIDQKAARAARATTNYDAALADASGREVTPAVEDITTHPVVGPVIQDVLAKEPFAGMSPTDPRVLHDAFTTLSAREGAALRGQESVNSATAKSARETAAEIGNAKRALLRAMEAPGQRTIPAQVADVPAPETAPQPQPSVREAIDALERAKGEAARRTAQGVAQQPWYRADLPQSPTIESVIPALERHGAEEVVNPSLTGAPGPRLVEMTPEQTVPLDPMMGQYRKGVNEYAADSRGIQATRTGRDALRSASGTLPSGKNLDKNSPEAFLNWLQNDASPEEQAKYLEGVMGAAKAQIKGDVKLPTNPLGVAGYPIRATLSPIRTVRAAQKMSGPLLPGPRATNQLLNRSAVAALMDWLAQR